MKNPHSNDYLKDFKILQGAETQTRDALYGDGIFTTGIVENFQVLNLEWHLDRVINGAAKLGFAPLDRAKLTTLFAQLTQFQHTIFRLTVTRQQTERGYALTKSQQIKFIVTLNDWKPQCHSHDLSKGEFRVFFAKTPININSHLAGIKHCSRLDNVLAASECQSASEEAIMCANQRVICGSKSNLFAYIDNSWVTPRLDDAGINGITRQRLLQSAQAYGKSISVKPLAKRELEKATAIFLTNAIWGIQPVNRLENKILDVELCWQLKSALKFER